MAMACVRRAQGLMLDRLSGSRSGRTILSDHMPSLPGKVPVGTCGSDIIIRNDALSHYKNFSILYNKYMVILPITLRQLDLILWEEGELLQSFNITI